MFNNFSNRLVVSFENKQLFFFHFKIFYKDIGVNHGFSDFNKAYQSLAISLLKYPDKKIVPAFYIGIQILKICSELLEIPALEVIRSFPVL